MRRSSRVFAEIDVRDYPKAEPAPSGGSAVKVCYCDESGIGEEPIAVMVGVIVDAKRMHLTKAEWGDLLKRLSQLAGKRIPELHTRNFYSGSGIWRDLDGEQRASILTRICEWLCERRHHIVYSSVVKADYYAEYGAGKVPSELNTPWRFMGFHLVLAIQKAFQGESNNKGHTLFVFDNEEHERMRFTDIINQPRAWSDEYYGRTNNRRALDQVIDVPYFGDSKEVPLIQVADVIAFFLRRYAEIKEGLVSARYADEEQRISGWIKRCATRSIGQPHIYPRVRRNDAADLFYRLAPPSIRELT